MQIIFISFDHVNSLEIKMCTIIAKNIWKSFASLIELIRYSDSIRRCGLKSETHRFEKQLIIFRPACRFCLGCLF